MDALHYFSDFNFSYCSTVADILSFTNHILLRIEDQTNPPKKKATIPGVMATKLPYFYRYLTIAVILALTSRTLATGNTTDEATSLETTSTTTDIYDGTRLVNHQQLTATNNTDHYRNMSEIADERLHKFPTPTLSTSQLIITDNTMGRPAIIIGEDTTMTYNKTLPSDEYVESRNNTLEVSSSPSVVEAMQSSSTTDTSSAVRKPDTDRLTLLQDGVDDLPNSEETTSTQRTDNESMEVFDNESDNNRNTIEPVRLANVTPSSSLTTELFRETIAEVNEKGVTPPPPDQPQMTTENTLKSTGSNSEKSMLLSRLQLHVDPTLPTAKVDIAKRYPTIVGDSLSRVPPQGYLDQLLHSHRHFSKNGMFYCTLTNAIH